MKSFVKVLILLPGLSCCNYSLLSAQSFEKGNKVISAGIKISIYHVNDPNDEDGEEDGGASYTIPIGFEYAITDRIGAGVELGFCNYFTGEDTITGTIASANSFDMLFMGNYHWVRGGRVDLYSGIGFGFSAFNYKSNDIRESQFNATGPYFRLGFMNARFFVSKSFALGLHLGIPYMNFNNGRINDNLGSDYSYPLSFVGFDIGTGLTFRF